MSFIRFAIAVLLGAAIMCFAPHHDVQAQGSVVFSTQGDVSMTGSAVALGTGTARYVDVIALAANSAAVRCANSTVSSSRGVPIAAGGAYRFGPLNNPSLVVDLSAIYCVGTNGDKVATIMGAN